MAERRLEISRMSPLRTGLLSGAGSTGVAFVVLMLISLLFVIDPSFDHGLADWLLGGVAVAAFALVTTGAGGFAGGVVAAALYNAIARLAGGVVVVLRDAEDPTGGPGGRPPANSGGQGAGRLSGGEGVMRKEIARISPLRVALITAAVTAVVYLATSLVMLLFGGLTGGMQQMQASGGMTGMGDMWITGGNAFLVVTGIIPMAIGGFVSGLLGALVYNLMAGIVGGIVIEMRDA